MSADALLTPTAPAKVCTKCGELKPGTAYRRRKTGLEGACRACEAARVRAWFEKKLAEEPEAIRARRRENVARHRANTDNATGREYGRAHRRAVKRLTALYPEEFHVFLAEELANERAR